MGAAEFALPAHIIGKCGHGHIAGDTAFVNKIQHLIIDHIIVTGKDTAAVWTFVESLGKSFSGIGFSDH